METEDPNHKNNDIDLKNSMTYWVATVIALLFGIIIIINSIFQSSDLLARVYMGFGMGLYFIGISLIVNGSFSQRKAFNILRRDIRALSQNDNSNPPSDKFTVRAEIYKELNERPDKLNLARRVQLFEFHMQHAMKESILYFSLAFSIGSAALFGFITVSAFHNNQFYNQYSSGLAFGGIFLAICAFIPIILEKIRGQNNCGKTQQKLLAATICTEDIRREINLQAIELKIWLKRIEEKLDNSVTSNHEISKKTERTVESTNEQKREDSILSKFHRLNEKMDNDGPLWKKMGEVYMGIGAIAIAIEFISFLQVWDVTSYRDVGYLQYLLNGLLQFVSTMSPGLTVLGVGLAVYAFGVSLVENQEIKKMIGDSHKN